MKTRSLPSLILTLALTATLLSSGKSASAQTTPPFFAQVPFVSLSAGNVSGGTSLTTPSSACATGIETTGGASNGDNCPANQVGVSAPWGTMVDSWGNVYFGDQGHGYLRVIYAGSVTVNGVANPATAMIEAANITQTGLTPQAGYVYALAGGLTTGLSGKTCSTSTYTSSVSSLSGDGSGCPATISYIKGAYGGAVDSQGNVFVIDKANSNIYVVLANTTGLAAQLVTLENPSATSPQVGSIYEIVGDGGGYVDGVLAVPGKAKIDAPYAIAVDANENVYIAETGSSNNDVRMINGPNTTAGGFGPGYIHAIAGNCTSSGCTALATTPSSAVPALGAAFVAPGGVVVDASDNVYIGDNSNAAKTVPSTLRVIYAGGANNPLAHLICLETGITSGCSSSLTAGDVYTIAGQGTANNSETTGSGTLATSSSVEFGRIRGLAIDQSANIYILDYNGALSEVNAQTGYLTVLAGEGKDSFGAGNPCGSGPSMTDKYGDGCPGPQSQINNVAGNFAVASSGNIYFPDYGYNIIQELTLASPGTSGPAFPATNVGTPAATQEVAFNLLTGSSSVPASNVSVAVLTQGSSSGTEFKDAGASAGDTCTGSTTLTGVNGSTNGTADTVCIVPVTFTPAQVGPRSGAVQITATINSTTQVYGTAFVGGIGDGPELSIDPTLASTIGSGTSPQGVATDSSGNTYIAWANGTIQSTPGGTLATAITGALSNPHQVAVDGAGDVYVADTGNNRIAEFTPGATAPVSLGTSLSLPQGVAVDSSGNLYIADTGNARVVVQPYGNGQQTVLGSGFSTPVSVAVDASGNVYVADSTLGSIFKVAAGNGAQTTMLSSIAPAGLTVDAAGDLYYVDTTLNQVVEIPVSGANDPAVTGLTTPLGVALDPKGGLYVADTANSGVSYYNRTASAQTFATPTASISATLTNIGNQSFDATNDTFTQTDSTDFSVGPSSSNGCSFGTSVTAGENCGVSALLTPSGSGTYNDVVTFAGNAVNSVTLNLTGTSAAATAGTTSTTLSNLTPAAPVYGQSVQVTATVAVTSSNTSSTSSTTTPAGTVTFYVDNVAQPPATLVNGAYTLTLPTLTAGSHTLSADYTSTNNFSPSTTTSILTINVSTLAITATVTSATSSMYGQAIAPLAGALTGVLPQDAANVTPLFSTEASSTAAAGTYPVTVTLNGSAANNYSVTLTNGMYTITPATTTTSLTTSNNATNVDTSVTLTATVTSSTVGTPTGTVTFYSGTTALATEGLSGGIATYNSTSLPTGSLALTATYNGATDYATSTSTPVSETISQPIVTGTLSSPSVSLSTGSTSTVTLNLTAQGGYTGTGTYSCTSLPAEMSCSFSPASSTFSASAPTATTTLTISTTGGNSTAETTSSRLALPPAPGHSGRRNTTLAAGLFFPAAFAGLIGFARRRKSWPRSVVLAVLSIATLAGMAALSGCGSSGTSGTPAGTYTIEVQITAGTIQLVPLTVTVK